MAKLNPGYDVHTLSGNIHRNLTHIMDSMFIDYSVKEKMFTFFEIEGCIPGTGEHALLEEIVNNNPWPKPITVYGYDDSWGLLGDLFEAETTCVKERNMGQVASTGVVNLGFFSREKEPVLKSNPDPEIATYNSSKTYISFVVGDGDALYEYRNMKDEMTRRVGYCNDDPDGCFPLIWSISPQMTKSAPLWIDWFYEQAQKTGKDFFILPPSGDLYSYPSLMSGQDRANFVNSTEVDAQKLDTSGTMAWEWVFSWEHAIKTYFPLYSLNNIVRGFFLVNVPYPLPIEAFFGTYKVVGGNTVLFKPLADWQRSTDGNYTGHDKKDNLTPAQMSDKINHLKPGTVTYVYMTHDHGSSIESIYHCVQNLTDHVEVVNHNNLVDMALSRENVLSFRNEIDIIQ